MADVIRYTSKAVVSQVDFAIGGKNDKPMVSMITLVLIPQDGETQKEINEELLQLLDGVVMVTIEK